VVNGGKARGNILMCDKMLMIINRIVMKIACITLLILFSVCCRAQTFVSEKNDSTVITEYNDGKLWVYRNVDNFIVGLACYEAGDGYGRYYQINVFVKNLTDVESVFDPSEISSRIVKNDGDTVELEVYTSEEFQKKVARSQTWALALYGLSTGINAGMAGYSNTYSSNGSIYTTYNANAAFQANMLASNQILTMGRLMEDERKVKECGYLKITTIRSGEGIIGYMNMKRKKGNYLFVDISLNGRVFSFAWDVSKKKRG